MVGGQKKKALWKSAKLSKAWDEMVTKRKSMSLVGLRWYVFEQLSAKVNEEEMNFFETVLSTPIDIVEIGKGNFAYFISF